MLNVTFRVHALGFHIHQILHFDLYRRYQKCVTVLQVHTLDEEVLEAAVTIQKLQRRRSNLKGLVHKLQVCIMSNA